MGTPMAFTTGTTYTYTDKMFKRGTIGLNLPSTLASGYNWWNGVDVTSSQYLIYSDTYTTGIATQANSRPTAWTTPDKTDASLLGLINTLPERIGQTPFTNVTDATTWLQESNRYFLINNGYEDIVTSGLTLSWDAAWYNSFKTGNTLWYDISGNYVNGTFTNGPSFSTSNGGSISFDGADDYVSASVSSPGPPITVETICRFNDSASDSSNYRYVFSLGSESSGRIISLSRAKSQSPDSPLLPNQGYCYIGSNNPIPINYIFTGSAYHHVVIQVLSDNQTIKCYIDGVEVSVGTNTTTISLTSTLNIGRYVNNNWYLNGNVQTFRIYNRVLSQAEILKNYNVQKGRIGYDNIVSTGLKLNLNSQIPLSYSGGGNSWYDLSGNNNTGTLTNGPTFNTTERSLVFDGTDDYVQTNYSGILGTNPRTFSVWFKPDTSQNRNLLGYGALSNHNMWDIILYQGNVGIHLYNSGAEAGTPYTVGSWQNITFTYTHPTIKSYMNGVYKNSYTSNIINTLIGDNLSIAKGAFSSYFYFDGNIPSIQIYNRELTAAEVLQNYYQGNIVTNGLVLNLDAGNLVSYGGTGTNWYNLSGSSNNGTLTNGTSYSTLNGGSLVFDGSDDYVSIPDINFTTATIDIWVYVNSYGGGGTVFIYQSNNGFEIWSDYNGLIRYNQNSNRNLTNGPGFSLNTWNHIVATSDGTVNKLYLNGVNIGSTNGGIFDNTNGDIRISGYDYYMMNGRCPILKMYNRALSAMEVQQNFNAHRGRYGI